jgi:hypothetical protein
VSPCEKTLHFGASAMMEDHVDSTFARRKQPNNSGLQTSDSYHRIPTEFHAVPTISTRSSK